MIAAWFNIHGSVIIREIMAIFIRVPDSICPAVLHDSGMV